jgi:hypothetical protein
VNHEIISIESPIGNKKFNDDRLNTAFLYGTDENGLLYNEDSPCAELHDNIRLQSARSLFYPSEYAELPEI